LVAVVSW